jgi:hypothetical protein
MASLFDTLRKESTATGFAARSKEAREWFMQKARELNGQINRNKLLNDSAVKAKPNPQWGFMYMFMYDALHKDTLPYYDRFPLIILLKPAEGGFMGMNLHYLEPKVRAIFLDKLMATLKEDELSERTRLRLRYSLLASAQRFRYFRPCLKHYLWDQIQSRIVQVHAPDWETAIFLPTEHFKGATKQKVWRESRKVYQKS